MRMKTRIPCVSRGSLPAEPAEPRHPEAGLSLVELMFAAGVLVVALTLVFGSIMAISEARGISHERALAAQQVSSILEDIGRLSFDELLVYDPPEFSGLRNGDAEIEYVDMPTDPDEEPPNPLEVKITLNWQDGRGRHSSESASAQFRR